MSALGWRLDDVEGIRVARCVALEAVAATAHAFSTRIAHRRSDFDLGPALHAGEGVERRRREFMAAAGLGASNPLILSQAHGDRIVSAEAPFERPPEADGSVRLLSEGPPAPVPAVRTADCVALLFVDRGGRAVAAAHAGWRGTAGAIAAKSVAALASRGVAAGDLEVAMGPAILGCCYEVGEEVVAAIERACPPGSYSAGRGARGGRTVDLHAANRTQLIGAGVAESAIHAAPWCTCCRNDLFFSVRAEGRSAGRLMAVVGPRASP